VTLKSGSLKVIETGMLPFESLGAISYTFAFYSNYGARHLEIGRKSQNIYTAPAVFSTRERGDTVLISRRCL